MGINNPVPQNLGSEARKAAKILTSFVKPNQLINYDEVIPPHILQNAKGLVILTVLKAGFLFSGRAGSGVIVARLPDGGWSPPSAVMTAGAGVGGQIGAELTDFIFVLNTSDAVKVFAKAGQLTLGGNVSLAAGPLGRNAEAAGAATAGTVSAIFSYSKTKGLFAGVSLEGSVIIERREANRKFYGGNCTARNILGGNVPPPRAVEPLFRVLESRAFSRDYDGSDFYGDMPSERDFDSESEYRSRGSRSRYDDGYERGSRYRRDRSDDESDDYGMPRRAANSSRSRDGYGASRYDGDRGYDGGRESYRDSGPHSGSRSGSGGYNGTSRYGDRSDRNDSRDRYGDSHYESKSSSAAAPAASSYSPYGTEEAIALFTFAGEESGDLAFKKGDVIKILKKSETSDDWWTGEINGRQGIFPANYVDLV